MRGMAPPQGPGPMQQQPSTPMGPAPTALEFRIHDMNRRLYIFNNSGVGTILSQVCVNYSRCGGYGFIYMKNQIETYISDIFQISEKDHAQWWDAFSHEFFDDEAKIILQFMDDMQQMPEKYGKPFFCRTFYFIIELYCRTASRTCSHTHKTVFSSRPTFDPKILPEHLREWHKGTVLRYSGAVSRNTDAVRHFVCQRQYSPSVKSRAPRTN